MRNEVLVLAIVSILAVTGLAISGQSESTGMATNPGLACDGYWTYLYGLEDGGGLQCVNTYKAPKGGSYAGGGELGTWAEPQNIRKKGATRGFTKKELEDLKKRSVAPKMNDY